MKVRIKDACILLIYLFSYIFALTYIYYGLTYSYSWKIVSSAPVFINIALGFIYLLSKRYIRLEFIGILMFAIVTYELVVSAANNMFIIPNIIIDVIAWPLLFIVFLDYSRDNELSILIANKITIIGMTLVCSLVAFALTRITRFGAIGGSTVFTTYLSFSFLPFVYLYCNKRLSTIFSAIVAVLMIFTLKRGAFIIVAIGISLYYILNSYIAGQQGKKIHRMILAVFILVAIYLFGWYLIDKYNIGILNRLSNAIDDGGSGRTRIWELVLADFNNSSKSERLFGHGFHSVFYNLRPFGKARFAHNSLIETLYDYGYVGLVLLIIFIVYLLAKTIEMIRAKSTAAPVMSYTMVSMIVLTAISYFFEESVMTIPHAMIWGICIGRFIRDKDY